MSLYQINLAHAATAAALHKASFITPWDEKAFTQLLTLPTTHGWISEHGLLLYSAVAGEIEILTLCTHPNARRQGVANTFLNTLETAARANGDTRIFLEVSVTNLPAQHLYNKHGFIPIGIRKNYYKTPTGFIDAVCMEKKL